MKTRRMQGFKTLPLSKVYQFIEQGPVVLLTTAHLGKENVMTMSWKTMLEFEPPLIAAVVSEGDYSFKALRATKQCVIAIPTAQMAEAVVGVGNTHGDRVNKWERFGLTPLPATQVTAPLVAECFVNLECRVIDTTLMKRYNLFVFEVVKAWIASRAPEPKLLHHAGKGVFVIDGEKIVLPSRMR